jgi:RIO-like serine/threonine protein kinase
MSTKEPISTSSNNNDDDVLPKTGLKQRLTELLKKVVGATHRDLNNVDVILKKDGSRLIIEFKKIDADIKSDLEKVLHHTRRDALGYVKNENDEITNIKYEIPDNHFAHDELNMLCEAWTTTHKEELDKMMDHVQTKL